VESIIKYQTTDGVLDMNKTKYLQGFDVILKLNMSWTCFGVWDMTYEINISIVDDVLSKQKL